MEKIIKIEGMSCGHCEARVKRELEALDGVKSADVSADDNRAVVQLEKEVAVDKLKGAVEEAGYTPVAVE